MKRLFFHCYDYLIYSSKIYKNKIYIIDYNDYICKSNTDSVDTRDDRTVDRRRSSTLLIGTGNSSSR